MVSLAWVIALSASASASAGATATSTASDTTSTSTSTASATAGAASAGEEGESEDSAITGPLGVEIHAFVSQGYIQTTHNNYLAQSKRGSPEFTEVGINFTRTVVDRLRLGLQLFARDVGPLGNYDAKLDWFYLDYRATDWIGFRAGRVKLPFGLYNDSSDVDAARVPILLPQSTYPIQNRDFLLSQTGGEIYGYLALGDGDFGGIDYRLYGGTIFLDATTAFNQTPETRVIALDVPYLAGGRLLYEAPFAGGLRAGGSIQALRLDMDLSITGRTLDRLKMMGTVTADSTGDLDLQIPAVLWMLSLEWTGRAAFFAAEYSRWHTTTRSAPGGPTVFPERTTISERFYGLIGRQFSEEIQASFYYSVLFPNIDNRKTRAGSQQDFALTLRWDINSFWLIKLEAHYLRGTAALSTSLNDDKMLPELDLDWALFLAKTTLYF